MEVLVSTRSNTAIVRCLEWSHSRRSAAVARLLIRAGARIEEMDKIGGTPLSYALCSGYENVASQLMKGAQAAPVDNIRRELLVSASKKGFDTVVQRLIRNGAATDVVDDTNRTSLSHAAENGHIAVVKILIETANADVNHRDSQQRTSLSHAAENGHHVVVKRLLDTSEADVNPRNTQGRTPLSYAAENGHTAMVKALLGSKTIELNIKDPVYQQTPLSLAAEKGMILW